MVQSGAKVELVTFDSGRVTREKLYVTCVHWRIDFAPPFHLRDIRDFGDRDVDKTQNKYVAGRCVAPKQAHAFVQLFATMVCKCPSKKQEMQFVHTICRPIAKQAFMGECYSA